MNIYCGDPDCEECQFTRVVHKGDKRTMTDNEIIAGLEQITHCDLFKCSICRAWLERIISELKEKEQ